MSRKVLVVDDEKLIVKGIRFNLEQDGMEVDCAYDGEEAVEIRHYPSGPDAAEDGRAGSMPADPGIFQCADRYAYCQRRRHGQDPGTGLRCR